MAGVIDHTLLLGRNSTSVKMLGESWSCDRDACRPGEHPPSRIRSYPRPDQVLETKACDPKHLAQRFLEFSLDGAGKSTL